MKYFKVITAVIMMFGFVSCHKTDVEPVIPAPVVASALQPYWQQFLQEGQKRGRTFTAKEQAVTLRFVGVGKLAGNRLGLTYYDTRTIDIDSTWLLLVDDEKKWLLFHELGHLMLYRSHIYFLLPNGEPQSLMWTTESDNSDNCSHPVNRGTLRQTYYLDELFHPESTAYPTWAKGQTPWVAPPQTPATTVVGETDWNNNPALMSLASTSPGQISYAIQPGTIQLKAGKQMQWYGSPVPISTLFPVLADAQLQNYEVRMRYKLYGRGFEMGWNPTTEAGNGYFLTSNFCPLQNSLGIGTDNYSFFWPNKVPQNLTDWNELVLRQKDGYIWVWLNQQAIFESDVTSAAGISPLKLTLYFGVGQYDFKYITVTRL